MPYFLVFNTLKKNPILDSFRKVKKMINKAKQPFQIIFLRVKRTSH